MKISYNWLKWYIPEAPTAEKLAEVFDQHLCEVESLDKLPDGDTIFDIKILPNRAHDLLSHQGVARELASLLNIKYVDPVSKYKVPESKPTDLKIEIESDKCRRYTGRIIRNVKVGASPDWVVKHLESIGQRSINNLVDAANIVMYDCGQPTHVFDLDKVKEKLVVRMARDGEKLTTLDNKDCILKSANMVIADSEDPLAVAGVKGGKIAEVDDNTKNIILEVANFDPTSVRKTAQALNIQTDAKKRFENDLSAELASFGMLELSALIAEMCPEAAFEDVVDVYPMPQEVRRLSFREAKIGNILGLEVSSAEIEDILNRYNISFTKKDGTYEIIVPAMRLDLTIEEDIAEEIGRVLGYDKVKGKLPKISFAPKPNETYNKIIWARRQMTSQGYSEVMTTSFSNKGEVSVLASASDKNFLRTNLSDGLKESLKLNQANAPFLGIDQVKIFEIGTVFTKGGEEMRLAYGNKKGIQEMKLSEFSPQTLPETFVQVLGSPSPTARPDHSQKSPGSVFTMWSLFPFIARDMAVWVGEGVTSAEVEEVIKNNMGEMVVRGPELFDEFKKEGKVSYAFRLVFQSFDRTLTDAEVNAVMAQITDKIKEKDGWQVR